MQGPQMEKPRGFPRGFVLRWAVVTQGKVFSAFGAYNPGRRRPIDHGQRHPALPSCPGVLVLGTVRIHRTGPYRVEGARLIPHPAQLPPLPDLRLTACRAHPSGLARSCVSHVILHSYGNGRAGMVPPCGEHTSAHEGDPGDPLRKWYAVMTFHAMSSNVIPKSTHAPRLAHTMPRPASCAIRIMVAQCSRSRSTCVVSACRCSSVGVNRPHSAHTR
jgi:hypothetical protein